MTRVDFHYFYDLRDSTYVSHSYVGVLGLIYYPSFDFSALASRKVDSSLEYRRRQTK